MCVKAHPASLKPSRNRRPNSSATPPSSALSSPLKSSGKPSNFIWSDRGTNVAGPALANRIHAHILRDYAPLLGSMAQKIQTLEWD